MLNICCVYSLNDMYIFNLIIDTFLYTYFKQIRLSPIFVVPHSTRLLAALMYVSILAVEQPTLPVKYQHPHANGGALR